jgi:signal transduction histidine kinase/FixJ family two-component response regulator
VRRLSIARSVQIALLGLTLALTTIAGLGVGARYVSRQRYEDRRAEALMVQAGAARLLAAGVTEEATLRLAPRSADATVRSRRAFAQGAAELRRAAAPDAPSRALVARAIREQAAVRRRPGTPRAPLATRGSLARLSARQDARIGDARTAARRRARLALVAILVGGGLALAIALTLVAAVVSGVRRPLDGLVAAAGRLAAGETGIRVSERDGPKELRQLATAFNAMASDMASARARVDAERRRLATTVRALGDALVITDPDGIVVEANPRAFELLPELRVGERISAPAPLEAALAAEVDIRRADRMVAVTAAALTRGAGHVWTIRDVTERTRLETTQREFVATASHELRSPLTSIKGFVELLDASSGLTARQREWLEIVRISTDRLVALVDDLLDVTRLEAGQVELRRRPTDVPALAAEVGRLLSARMEERGQRFVVEAATGLSRALVDPDRLRQILGNLLTNAHLYSEEGGLITVQLEADDETLVVRVINSGVGMSAEQVSHVFDRFYRASDRDGPAGTGLGLPIVQSLVELHGGTIALTSAEHDGACFALRLPHALDPDHDAPRGHGRDRLAGRRVLVVDDDPATALEIAAQLAEADVSTRVVHSGPEALAALREEPFDALTLDILMPGMTGFEVLREMRAEPALAGLPVVVVSVFSGREALRGEWVVPKPVETDVLVDALGAAVATQRIRVLAIGAPASRPELDAELDRRGIERDWALNAREVTAMCVRHQYEVALLDAAVEEPHAILDAIELRGRRMRHAVLVFSGDGADPGFGRLDARSIAVPDAGAAVVELLGHAGTR